MAQPSCGAGTRLSRETATARDRSDGLNVSDQFMLALTAWRENRGGGRTGMQSVMNVILNRASRRNSTAYEECVRPWQFTSITGKNDPQLMNWPAATDPAWQEAQNLAANASTGDLADITSGATSYYALSMTTPPTWASALTKTVEIEGQAFFK